ncbi:MAG: alpha/beta hydrolase [Devosia sp.]|nr:alpha/beta hydrolase [Devosia sp.]
MNDYNDDDLARLEADGLRDQPRSGIEGSVETDGAQIWYASFGTGPALVLLHGGLGNSGNWAFQVPHFVAAGYRVITIDSRGHGRSSRDRRPLSYWLMAADLRAVLDCLGIARAAVVGWSDGADVGLIAAHDTPERIAALVFFACNVDATGTLPFVFTPTIGRIYNRHVADYARLSPTPEAFDAFSAAVNRMQASEPDYSAADLAVVHVPVLSLIGDGDEFIRQDHARYIAGAIPGARFRLLEGVSHFAPLQRPALFDAAVLDFLAEVWPAGPGQNA